MKEQSYFILTVIFCLTLDQITKAWVVKSLQLGETIPIIKDFFHFTYIINPGAAFGILKDKIWLFALLTILVFLVIFWINYKEQGLKRIERILFGLIAGGAIGNLIDRLKQGAVIDFIDFRGIWPYIFNIADIGVVIGGLLLVSLYIWREQKKEKD